MIKKPETVG
jgi:hypothetical protein